MREILFRGKRVDNGEWVEGYFFPLVFSTIPGGVAISGHDGANWREVHPETVGQFTGLTDKNGAKIFEGDIVRCIANYDAGNCVVIYEDGEFRLVPDRYYRSYTTGGGFHAVRCFTKEAIGNIHDTPEPLKEE